MSDAAKALSSIGPLTTSVNPSVRRRWLSTPRYWTNREEENLERLREVDGLPPSEIAQRMGRTEQSVTAKIARMGLQLPDGWKRARSRTLSPVKEATLRRCWNRGDTIDDAALAVGTSKGTAGRYYREFAEAAAGAARLPAIGTFIGHKEMMAIVAPICGVPASAIVGPTRHKPNVCARMAIARALRDRNLSLPQIARKLGRTDHTSILHYLRKFDSYGRVYPEVHRAYEAIKKAEARAAERLAA